MTCILLVDDEEMILKALTRTLRKAGLESRSFSSATEALAAAEELAFDVVISDYRMPEMDGIRFLSRIRQLRPEAARLILSAHTDMDALLGAINEAQIYRYITKPWSDAELLLTINQALEHQRLIVENQKLADQVRQQRGIISRQDLALKDLEREHPALARVTRDADGAILLEEQDD